MTVRTMADFKMRHNLHYPLIVKPACEDGSGGIENASIVTSLKELRARVEFVLEDFKMDALVEEYIDGRELELLPCLATAQNAACCRFPKLLFRRHAGAFVQDRQLSGEMGAIK